MATLLGTMPPPDDRENQILVALGDFYGLTIKQVMELYGWKSFPRATEAFKRITYEPENHTNPKDKIIYQQKQELIYRLRRHGLGKETLPGDVYFLLRDGAKQVRELGLTPTFSFELNKARLLRPGGMEHTLLVNEVLIKLKLFSDTHQNHFRLQNGDHERSMRNKYEKAFHLYPDGFIQFYIKQGNKFNLRCCFLELEHTSAHDKEKWKSKVRGYIDLFQTKLDMYFQTDKTFVVVIVINPEFTRHLRNWTEETLRELNKEEYRTWFCFGSFEQTLSPVQFFCTKRFYKPFDKSPHEVFDGLVLSGNS